MHKALLAVLVFASSSPASAAWQSKDTSAFTFEVSFEGEPLAGSFTDFDVQLDFDPGAAEEGLLTVTVLLNAADMGDPDMNAVLFDPAWFDVERFAEATFRSDSITVQDDGSFVAAGTLDLKGTRGPVAVPFTWQQTESEATMQGEFLIRRTDFGVGDGEWASDDSIGRDVRLEFSVQLERTD